jgi:hypothetical protein
MFCLLLLLLLNGCRPRDLESEASSKVEEATLPPGVTAPPMTGAQQKIADDLQASLHQSLIHKAMEEFHAAHERYPGDHEEFMAAIVEANAIALPDPPQGKRYQYNPDRHSLELVDE